MDFLRIKETTNKDGTLTVSPAFVVKKSKDLMIRGNDFYAVWNPYTNLWATDEDVLIDMVDKELEDYANKRRTEFAGTIHVKYMWDSDSLVIDKWHKYCQKQMRQNYVMLDNTLIFADQETVKEDYASKKLPYALCEGSIDNWDKLVGTLYSPEEREKIEWCIGAIVTGDSKTIQKFAVFYGSHGTGKSSILKVIEKLFQGYTTDFDAKALGKGETYALSSFRNNPLVAIQQDGNLSRIDDNATLNSLISHETVSINEKYKGIYEAAFSTFLLLASNKPVQITDSRSGLIRRLIEISPTGNLLESSEYKKVMAGIEFELGAIASHCKDVYLSNPERYDDYVPLSMMSATNDFHNFIESQYLTFAKEDGTSLNAAWKAFKEYCDFANIQTKMPYRIFREEMMNYFDEFHDTYVKDGNTFKGYFTGFRADKLQSVVKKVEKREVELKPSWLYLKEQPSKLDEHCAYCDAQLTNKEGSPLHKWASVKTKLKDINTSKLHFLKMETENHIVVDFDLKTDGEKDLEKNIKAAMAFPKTYAEVSRSGGGLHLHYIYDGDVETLSRVYSPGIEIKIYSGDSSLRRQLTLCNAEEIAHISSGLPLKEEKKMIDSTNIKDEQHLRVMIKKNLNKEFHDSTASSVSYIKKLLDDAYESKMAYDVSDLKQAITSFALGSTNQANNCLKMVAQMQFKSESELTENYDIPYKTPTGEVQLEDLIIFDIEVYPNLFLICYKKYGEGNPVHRLYNPAPSVVEKLFDYPLVGFNNRKYDNHILYGASIGATNMELFNRSQRIINSSKTGDQDCFYARAYGLSYTDIYDLSTNKQSLKKWEIELGINHKEMDIPWDQPVPENKMQEVGDYCENDVLATEAVLNACMGDFEARKIQCAIARAIHGDNIKVSPNMTTNQLSARIIFGNDKNPQSQFNYRDLSKPVIPERYEELKERMGDYRFRVFDADGIPQYRDYIPGEELPAGWSIMPFFPDYTYDKFKRLSIYLGEEIGEGGRVYTEPGFYGNVYDGDVESMHPNSIIQECLFGPVYTKRFSDIVWSRLHIKHAAKAHKKEDSKAYDDAIKEASQLLDGALLPFLKPELLTDLAQALKIVINSIYGLTSASYSNEFKDERNIDNIVAKRGALFMTLLKREIIKEGYKVCHIKTDSIKVPNADQHIREFIINFGLEFGYKFDTEAVFSKYCLFNKAVYIGYHSDESPDDGWTATGAQFKMPYVYKTLLTKEEITLEDVSVTNQVKGAIYLETTGDLNTKHLWKQINNIAKKGLTETVGLEQAKDINGVPLFDKKGKPKMIFNHKVKYDQYTNTLYMDDREVSDEMLGSYLDTYKDMVELDKEHNYRFVGKIGAFTPVKDGCGLYSYNDNKLGAVADSTGYLWRESSEIESMDEVDLSFFNSKVDEALDDIRALGVDPEMLFSDASYEDCIK